MYVDVVNAPGAPIDVSVRSSKRRANKFADIFPVAAGVGAKRYIRVKFMMEPTTRVENTKSSSFKPQLGRVDMSPITEADTPMICKTRMISHHDNILHFT